MEPEISLSHSPLRSLYTPSPLALLSQVRQLCITPEARVEQNSIYNTYGYQALALSLSYKLSMIIM